MHEQIDPRLEIGTVTLTVADIERSLRYYEEHIGLTLQHNDGQTLLLGVDERPLLRLHQLPGAKRFPNATGLYHFALRVPSRAALAAVVRHFIDAQTPVGGASDHKVSEALYLSDPDGHGIEIYRDRPRDQWYDANGNFHMSTDPLDFDELMTHDEGNRWQGLPSGSDMGHIHLQVHNVNAAEAFYTQALGMQTMTHYPGAAFISAGGYHHHIGMNVWHSRGSQPPPADAARLLSYELLLSDDEQVSRTVERLDKAGVAYSAETDGVHLRDPAGNGVIVRVRSSG